MSKDLKEQGYYKEKGVIEKVVSKYLAQISMHKSGDILQVSIISSEQPLYCQNGSL